MILNPIQIHEHTLSYSAQGFNRTFAAIIDAAHYLDHQLVMEDEDMLDRRTLTNPWDQDVSMLNITTKTFGTGGRGWVGRTVKIRQVAKRWCRFRELDDYNAELL
ncbi:hypothetical protein KCU81_g2985, partial [Aureobasidium melanogenum]